jgi:hypothetical protein
MKLINPELIQAADESLGETRQDLRQCVDLLQDYVELYTNEYNRNEMLQARIDTLKAAQRRAHLPYKGLVE